MKGIYPILALLPLSIILGGCQSTTSTKATASTQVLPKETLITFNPRVLVWEVGKEAMTKHVEINIQKSSESSRGLSVLPVNGSVDFDSIEHLNGMKWDSRNFNHKEMVEILSQNHLSTLYIFELNELKAGEKYILNITPRITKAFDYTTAILDAGNTQNKVEELLERSIHLYISKSRKRPTTVSKLK